MVSNPAGYNVPCLLPHPIRVDRTQVTEALVDVSA